MNKVSYKQQLVVNSALRLVVEDQLFSIMLARNVSQVTLRNNIIVTFLNIHENVKTYD